jgi:acyl carrier protein
MTRTQFVTQFAEILNVPATELTPERAMTSIESWDSVMLLSAMVFIDSELGLTIRPEKLSSAATFGDILAAVAANLDVEHPG